MPQADLCIQRALWQDREVDLWVLDGRIHALHPSLSSPEIEARKTVSARGLMLLPGFIDSHAHLREPGQEYKEDIATGLEAALCGGFCQVMCMANTEPVNDQAGVTELMRSRARSSHPQGPQLFPVGALSKRLRGEELAPMYELAQAGCIAFSNDGIPVGDSGLFRRALEYSADLGLPVIDHCEDPGLSGSGVINEGRMSDALGLPGQPTLAESTQVSRDILLAAYLDIPVHLAHISCRESVELLFWAKRKGIPVSAETCPHYLVWNESLASGYNTLAKVNPPLRTNDDRLALCQGVRDGTIDTLATDHAPHADFEKEAPFAQAANGISGLDTALSLTWSLIEAEELGLADALRLWCERPAAIFRLASNGFQPGDPADFFLFHPGEPWTVSEASLKSKGKNTPCLGQELKGKVKMSCIRGSLAYTEEHEPELG